MKAIAKKVILWYNNKVIKIIKKNKKIFNKVLEYYVFCFIISKYTIIL